MNNGNGSNRRDVGEALVGAAIDAFIIFLLMLPGTNLPTGMDFYIAIRVSLMVFAYSLARNLKLNIHVREFIGLISSKSNGCICQASGGDKENDKRA